MAAGHWWHELRGAERGRDVERAMRATMRDRAERSMRKAIAAIPDGVERPPAAPTRNGWV